MSSKKKVQPIYRKIIREVAKIFDIWTDSYIYGDKTDRNGLIINEHDRSLEDYLFCNKRAEVSLCTETPGLLSLDSRIQVNLENIRLLSKDISKN